MNKKQDILAKVLNKMLLGDKFVNKNLDEYIYASLTQPPIRIVDKNNSDDELDYTIECPNCHRCVNYGEETFMVRWHIYCINEDCRKEVYRKVGVKYENN